MSEQTAVDPSQPRLIRVAAEPDHIESLARGRPISSLAELVWNALDADADHVQIKVEENDLGSPEFIEIVDNGLGIDLSDAERAFGNLGGSSKRDRPYSDLPKKKMHGRDGKGRFKAFALGRKSMQAELRLMVKRILRKYKYPPDQQEGAVDLVLQQARALGEAWAHDQARPQLECRLPNQR